MSHLFRRKDMRGVSAPSSFRPEIFEGLPQDLGDDRLTTLLGYPMFIH